MVLLERLRSALMTKCCFSEEEAEAFINKPQMREAVEMRRFDDRAKILNKKTPSVEHFRKYVENSFIL